MIKRILVAAIIGMLAIGFNVVPAEAYTELKTPVSITASGILAGVTEAFSVAVVTQATGAAASLVFESPSGVHDSGEALKIKGGTNEVNSRIIVYTDNNLNPNVPTVDPSTGIDGSGLVGETEPGHSVALLWGVKSAANGDPNINENYVFDGNTDDGIGEIYIVDTRHTHSFTSVGSTEDNSPVYDGLGTPVPNTANDGLYPQRWDEDLYSDALATTVISEALFKNIATACFNLGHDGTNYVCNVPKLTTADPADNVTANLGVGVGDGLYIYIAGDFRGKPAQTYSTTQLNLAIVQD